jgi:hypothetical protein
MACFAGCGRWNIFGSHAPRTTESFAVRRQERDDWVVADYFDYWLSLEPLDEDCKGVPAEALNKLGWRKLPDNNPLHLRSGIFIPAFNADRSQAPFCQVRHLEGDRRFSSPSRVKPLVFGMESIQRMAYYIPFVEGNRDRAVLEMVGVPCLAIPSASSGKLLKSVAKYANDRGAVLVACSDKDDAGDDLLRSLDSVAPYVDNRPPKPYKDYAMMYEELGANAVRKEVEWIIRENQKKQILNIMS